MQHAQQLDITMSARNDQHLKMDTLLGLSVDDGGYLLSRSRHAGAVRALSVDGGGYSRF